MSNVVASIFDDSVVTRSRLDYDHGITKQGVAKLFSEGLAGQTETILDVAALETRDELAGTEGSLGLL